jgi:hypothetical protein
MRQEKSGILGALPGSFIVNCRIVPTIARAPALKPAPVSVQTELTLNDWVEAELLAARSAIAARRRINWHVIETDAKFNFKSGFFVETYINGRLLRARRASATTSGTKARAT